MQSNTALPTLAAGLVLAVAGASAASAMEPNLSRAQAAAIAKERFSVMDANRDGVISENEFTARALAVFDAVDTNGDQIVSRYEAITKRNEARSMFGLSQ